MYQRKGLFRLLPFSIWTKNNKKYEIRVTQCYKFFFQNSIKQKSSECSAKVWKIWHIFYGGRHYSTPTNTYKSLHLHSARKKTLNFTTFQFPLKKGGFPFLQSLLSCTDLAPWISNNVYQYCNTSCWKKVNQPATISRNFSLKQNNLEAN